MLVFSISCKSELKPLGNESSSIIQYSGVLDGDIEPSLIDHYNSFWLRDTLARGDFSIGETNYLVEHSYNNELSNTSLQGVVYKGTLTPEYTQNLIENGSFVVCGTNVPYDNERMRYYYESKGYSPIWGTTCEIRLGNGMYQGFTTSMYIPQSMHIISPFVSTEDEYLHPVGSSLNLEWSADSQNDKGVIITLHPLALNPAARDTMSYTMDIKRYLVKDDGQATIPAEAFTDLPRGYPITVALSRSNFSYIPNNHHTEFYSLSASTSTSILITLK